MDRTDEAILDLMKGNARISFQELGNSIGMSRVGAKKRVHKLEAEGIIRGYNISIYRESEITLLIDIVTLPEKYEKVLKYVSTKTAFVRQIYRTTRENHIHLVAVSDSVADLKYLTNIIRKNCGDDIQEFRSSAVKEVIKDVYGRIGYEDRSARNREGDYEPVEWSRAQGEEGR